MTEHATRDLLRLATAGSVDDGKSTLIGRLLLRHEVGARRPARAPSRPPSLARGGGEVDLALLTDGLRAEREQGITIDVAYRYFSTRHAARSCSPTPRGTCSTRATWSPAPPRPSSRSCSSTPARASLEQTRRHAAIAALLARRRTSCSPSTRWTWSTSTRPSSTAIAADFDRLRRRARHRRRHARSRSRRCAATTSSTAPTRTPWYAGPTLLEHLETVPGRPRRRCPSRSGSPSRSSSVRARPSTPTTAATPAGSPSGVVRVGDEVAVLPSGKRSTRRRHRHVRRPADRGARAAVGHAPARRRHRRRPRRPARAHRGRPSRSAPTWSAPSAGWPRSAASWAPACWSASAPARSARSCARSTPASTSTP